MAALPSVSRWSKDARAAAYKWGIPVKDLLGLVQIETGGNEGETSPTGAQGLTQFEPGTARGYHVNVAPGHAASQLEGAAHYLHDLGFAKNPTLALASYNAGPANPGAGMGYAGDVLSAAKNYSSLGGPRSVGGRSTVRIPSPHATTARAGTTTTQQTSEQAQPDITGLLSALGQQSQPSFVRANFDPGQNKYLRQGNTAPTPGLSAQQTGTGDLSGQIAALSSLVGPEQKTTTTTTGGGTTGTTAPAPKQTMPAVKGKGPSAASAFANSRVGDYAESGAGGVGPGNNRGPQLDALEKRVGMTGEKWCSIFATTVVVHGGAPTSARSASVAQVATMAQNGQNGYQKGLLSANDARRGDVILRGTEHIGYVDGRTKAGGIIVIEGNANGTGGVAKRIYSPGAWTAVARPTYKR